MPSIAEEAPQTDDYISSAADHFLADYEPPYLGERVPADVRRIVAEDTAWACDWARIKAARQRIANGECIRLTAEMRDAIEDSADEAPDAPPPQRVYEPEVAARVNAPYQRNERGQNTLRHPAQRRAASLKLLTPADCAASQSRGYVVKGLIAPRDLVLMVAKPGGGKSALAPAIGYAIAQGRPVFGRRTKPGTVLYVPVEDPHGMRQRVHALKLTRGDAPNFLTVEGVSDLFSPDSPDPGALLELATSRRPARIVIDTVAAAWRGMEENEGADMARVIGVARSLADEGCAVMLLCHPAKAMNGDGTARGHGSLNGDADVSLFLEWQPDGSTITARMTKNRNGPAYGDSMAFTIKGVRIGTDEDGDAIFSPVAQEAEGAATAAKGKPTADGVALGFLAALIASQGQLLPVGDGYPPGLSCVTEEEWRRACDSQRLSIAATEANRNRAFNRAYANLLFRQAVGARDGLVWIPRQDAGS